MKQFTWLPFFSEMLAVICERYDKQTLCKVFHEVFADAGGTQDNFADGTTGPLQEIDPLTFIGYFNRQIKWASRVEYCKTAKHVLGLDSDAPSDFDSIPTLNNQQSWFFGYTKDRGDHDIDNLWKFSKALNELRITNELFSSILKIRNVGLSKLTQLMFICKPKTFISLDRTNRNYFRKNDIEPSTKEFEKPADGYDLYKRFVDEVLNHFAPKTCQEISYDAYLDRDGMPSQDTGGNYWAIAPGENAELWEDFKKNSIIAIGWDKLGDLTEYGSKEEVRARIQQLYGSETSKTNSALACYEFAHIIQPGDFVFVKKGRRVIVGFGKVLSGYIYDNTRLIYQHTRKVEWLSEGNWELPKESRISTKALTDMTKYPDWVQSLLSAIKPGGEVKPLIHSTEVNYWWLNANPKIWNFADVEVGGKQTYTSHNEKGNKRRIYKHFESAKKGDIVLGYVSSPDKEIVAVCRITQGLHETDEGMAIEFEKEEKLNTPIPLKELQVIPALAICEPLINNQGSLFKLASDEYEIIRDLIDEKNPKAEKVVQKYTKAEALKDLFINENKFSDILHALSHKKNIVLQGAPGVGKTYMAKRLAYTLIGVKDKQRVQMIQFHQSYSYEDFIQGYRPNDDGKFDLKNGIFYEFCKRAQRDKDSDYDLTPDYVPHVIREFSTFCVVYC